MASKTSIEYLDYIVNPYPGCMPISSGCKRCWAKKTAEGRLRGRCGYDKDKPFEPGRYSKGWIKRLPHYGNRVGVNFMGDLFGNWTTLDQRRQVIRSLAYWPHVTCMELNKETKARLDSNNKSNIYLFLTKRYQNIDYTLYRIKQEDYQLYEIIKENCYFGVSVCNQYDWNLALGKLKGMKDEGYKTWVSFEPLLEHIGLHDEAPFDWAVVGGESGEGARQLEPETVQILEEFCEYKKIPFYFKQWGDYWKDRAKEYRFNWKKFNGGELDCQVENLIGYRDFLRIFMNQKKELPEDMRFKG